MLSRLTSSESFIGAIVIAYLTPVIVWGGYVVSHLPVHLGWFMILSGIILALFGTVGLFLLSKYREAERLEKMSIDVPIAPQATVIAPEPQIVIKEIDPSPELQATIERQHERIVQLEEDVHAKEEHLKDTLDTLQSEHANVLTEKERLLEEHNEVISNLRQESAKKQQAITQLETQISDLRYEIKTLLNLTEIPPELEIEPLPAKPATPQRTITTPEEASQLLKRCVDIAQKMTGAYHLNNSRVRELNLDHQALDLRRLFDALRSESTGLVLIYSQKENKVIFANNRTREFFDLTPEHFTQDFSQIISPSIESWQNSVIQLLSKSETSVKLDCRLTEEKSTTIEGCIGSVPSGLFRGYILGVFYNQP